MKDFRSLLNCFRDLPQCIESLTNVSHKFTSDRLKILCSFDTDGGLIPRELLKAIEEMDQFIVWKKLAGDNKTEIPEP